MVPTILYAVVWHLKSTAFCSYSFRLMSLLSLSIGIRPKLMHCLQCFAFSQSIEPSKDMNSFILLAILVSLSDSGLFSSAHKVNALKTNATQLVEDCWDNILVDSSIVCSLPHVFCLRTLRRKCTYLGKFGYEWKSCGMQFTVTELWNDYKGQKCGCCTRD